MAQKTKGFVKYGVIIIIIAVMLGGCKKDDKPEEKTTPPEETSSLPEPDIKSTPIEIKETKMTEKMLATNKKQISDILKIAAAADGWRSELSEYYGKDAPNMILKDLEGKSLSISGLKGKKAVIISWRSMHEPSKQMVKTLAELQKQIGPENLAIIAISSEDPAILKPIVKEMDIPFPVAGRQSRKNRMVPPYRTIRETPVCFFIDKEGKIQLIALDVIPPDAINSLIEAL